MSAPSASLTDSPVLRAAAVSVVAGVCVAACRTAPPALQPAVASAPLAVGPITFFEDRCARCQGSYGAMYAPDIARRLDRPALAHVVLEMVEGPAQARLDPHSLAALVAYHESLDDARPFLAVTLRRRTQLAGDVTPGSFVRGIFGDRSFPAVVIGHDWGMAIPDDVDVYRVVLEAVRGEARTILAPGRVHSHQP